MGYNIFEEITIAENYDAYYATAPGKTIDDLEKQLVRHSLQLLPQGHMLELGCGTGHWTAFFAAEGFEVTAVDSSAHMLAQAAKKMIHGVTFEKADALHLPFGKEAFNLVSSITMLEFVPDKQRAIEEMYRVLKPGGWLLVGALNGESALGASKDADEVFKHGDFFTLQELKMLLTTFGEPQINGAVHLSPDFKIADGTPDEHSYEPAFFVGIVQKTKA